MVQAHQLKLTFFIFVEEKKEYLKKPIEKGNGDEIKQLFRVSWGMSDDYQTLYTDLQNN